MIEEVQRSLTQIEENLQRLGQIQGQLSDSVEIQDRAESLRIDSEIARLKQGKDQLQWRIREAESLRDGAEIFYQNCTRLVSLRVGDDYVESTRTEVIVRDGKVVEIRQGNGD